MPAAVITGSSRGIGRAIALRYARDGYDVAVNYVANGDAAERVADRVREIGREAIAVRADVSNPEEAADLVETAVDAFGCVDHLVNNAGIDQHVYTENLSAEEFGRVMAVNVDGAFNVTKAALGRLRASSADPTPSVCNVSSILGHTGAAIECHYAASKAGLLGLTKSHAHDFAPGIRVNAVAPGHVETDMTADRSEAENEAIREEIPLDTFGRPEDVAEAVSYLRDARFVTGETLDVNGGELMR